MKRFFQPHWLGMIFGYFVTVSALAAPPEDRETTLHLTITPSVPTQPLLQHRFVFTVPEQTTGNAAVKYGKVFAEQQAFVRYDDYWLREHELRKMSLAELKHDKVAQYLASYPMLFDNIHSGAICETCDWQLPIRRTPFYEILLPEIQQVRSFARMLIIRARLQIAEGDFDGAIATMRDGFGLARHVADAPVFINPAIGAQMVRNLCRVAMELQQQPDAPNLIWAWTTMADPFIDFRRGMEGSLYGVELSFDFVQHFDSDDFTKEYWDAQLRQVWEMIVDGDDELAKSLGAIETWSNHAYPLAKKRLIASGIPADVVEKMPVSRVILRQSYHEYQQQLQHRYRWTFLPYNEAKEQLKEEQNLMQSSGDILPLEKAFSINFGSLLDADFGTRSYLALLQNIEAIRWHAALNDGQLPESLDQVTVAPVPLDPLTGERFRYELDGDTAIITAVWENDQPNRFEVQVADSTQNATPKSD
ncbi:hypothetical protein [Allorhodopirellula solitaria]|uniref:SLA1 homology domain-containing protein n=1 Tax=Allorhodopirellula solitaria TaxID=2527987 RepID=A0A5C5XA61_9BACT|nr:hypothetical protein [Allorhodopirellula solitaria]TWT59291.1 hypothetical protein CA85_39870 [Allorhodopirellula solitaria]